MRTQFSRILGAPRQTVNARPSAQHRGGAQADITTANQQDPDHGAFDRYAVIAWNTKDGTTTKGGTIEAMR